MKEFMNKTCNECGRSFSGRKDKKFCDDACRTNFNNRKNQDTSADFRQINAILKRNRSILQTFVGLPDGTLVSRKDLLDSGFRPEYVTQIQPDPAGGIIRYCYDLGVRFSPNKEIQVFWKSQNSVFRSSRNL